MDKVFFGVLVVGALIGGGFIISLKFPSNDVYEGVGIDEEVPCGYSEGHEKGINHTECYRRAVKEKDFRYCGFMDGELATSCYNTYANLYSDVEACKEIQKEVDRNPCIINIATVKADDTLCKYTDSDWYDVCIENVKR